MYDASALSLTSLALEHSKRKLPVYGGQKRKDFIYDPLSKDPTHMFMSPCTRLTRFHTTSRQ